MQKIFWINCLILVAVALNLRLPITMIGPLVEEIKTFYGIGSSMAGFLNAIPVICFGSIAFVVGFFSGRKAMLVALILMIVGILMRSYGGIYGLFAGMAILGGGIAVANVLLPSFVKEKFPHKVTSMMSLYSLVLNISTIFGIFIALPLFAKIGLQHTLGFCAIFSVIAIFLYIPQIKNHRISRHAQKIPLKKNLFINPSAWKITLFMGLQSTMACSTFAWYASIIASLGYSQHYGSQMLLFSQIIAAPVALFGPLFYGYLRDKWRIYYMAILCGLYVIGYGILLFSGSKIALYISAIALGIPMGGVFGIALLFISIKSQNTQIAAKLSSMAQGFGYIIASMGPFLVGMCNDFFGEFWEGIILLLCVAVALNIMGILAYKSKMIA